tara:strand:- start:5080 stop:5412 length:333 start_codon:yes stop_codon:yes gene_type:complete
MNINNGYSNLTFVGSRLSHDNLGEFEMVTKPNSEITNNWERNPVDTRDFVNELNDNFKISNSDLKAVVSTNGFNDDIVITERGSGDVITKLSLSTLSLGKNTNKLINEVV